MENNGILTESMTENTTTSTLDTSGIPIVPVVNEEPIDTKELEEAKEFARKQLYLTILKGVRPSWLEYSKFKELRNAINTGVKKYKKGKWIHNSNWFVDTDDKGKQEIKYINKGISYVKSKEKTND
jgi:hypothetical protein